MSGWDWRETQPSTLGPISLNWLEPTINNTLAEQYQINWASEDYEVVEQCGDREDEETKIGTEDEIEPEQQPLDVTFNRQYKKYFKRIAERANHENLTDRITKR